MSIAAVASFLSYRKGNRRFIVLTILLVLTIIIEKLSLSPHFGNYVYTMHIFNLIEYSLFCLYFLQCCTNRKLKLCVGWSIPLFAIYGTCVSIFKYQYDHLPADNLDLEGILLFIMYTHLLFNIDVDINRLVYTHPDFWIATGIMVFFGGVFVLFGVYSGLKHASGDNAGKLYESISHPLNLFLYTCINVGIICSLKYKKYS